MEEDIIRKLKNSLDKPIEEERVVYIFAETRKLLERKGLKNNYPTLAFYCDWILHSSIDRLSRLQNILEGLVEGYKKTKKIDNFLKFIEFEALKKDMQRFLSALGLSSDLFDYKKWGKFKFHIMEILKDCSLKGKCDPIKELVFKKVGGSGSSYEIELLIKFPDGTSVKHNYSEADAKELLKG